MVHVGQAEPLGGVSRSGLPHLVAQVGAHADAGVVEALNAVGEVRQGRGEGGVGAVTGPRPPADVRAGSRDDRATRMHSWNVLVADLGQDPLRTLSQRYRRVRPEQDFADGAGQGEASPGYTGVSQRALPPPSAGST